MVGLGTDLKKRSGDLAVGHNKTFSLPRFCSFAIIAISLRIVNYIFFKIFGSLVLHGFYIYELFILPLEKSSKKYYAI